MSVTTVDLTSADVAIVISMLENPQRHGRCERKRGKGLSCTCVAYSVAALSHTFWSETSVIDPNVKTTPPDVLVGTHHGGNNAAFQIGKLTTNPQLLELRTKRLERGQWPVNSMRLDEGNPTVKQPSHEHRWKQRKTRN